MLCFAAWPTETDRILFDKIAFNINVNWNSTYLVASFHKNITEFDKAQGSTLVAVSVYLILVLVVALTLMVFCTTAIVKAVQKSANEKTRRLQIQLYRTSIAQFVIPFCSVHVPFYVCVLAPLIELSTGEISNYLPFLFVWSTAINPLAVLFFVRDYRVFLLKKFKRNHCDVSVSNSAFQTTSRTK